jgi:hypothetical protein
MILGGSHQRTGIITEESVYIDTEFGQQKIKNKNILNNKNL